MYDKVISYSKLKGEVIPPPSKSILHRYIIAASLANGISQIKNISYSDDIKATIEAMKKLGAKIKSIDDTLLIDGSNTFFNISKDNHLTIDCNESGSTLRFLIPISLIKENSISFRGKGKLFKRPLEPYLKNFDEKNILYNYTDENSISFSGRLTEGIYEIDGDISSQFITGLLFSLPLLDKDSKIIVNGNLESKSYIDMTLECLKNFNINIINNSYKEFFIKGKQRYKSISQTIEADFSQAAFFIVANSLGSDIDVKNLNLNSLQGDKKIIEYVSIIDKWNKEENLIIDGSETPDIVPILTLKAVVSQKEIEIINIARLRIKESDRLKATVDELTKLGYDLIEKEESILINSRKEKKESMNNNIISVSSHSDHRIAMMLAIASGLKGGKIRLDNLDCVNKSYPNFWEIFLSLGGKIE